MPAGKEHERLPDRTIPTREVPQGDEVAVVVHRRRVVEERHAGPTEAIPELDVLGACELLVVEAVREEKRPLHRRVASVEVAPRRLAAVAERPVAELPGRVLDEVAHEARDR